jgi:pyridoxamine 5'-phosphate oxidase
VTAELDAEIEKADHKLNDDPGLVPDEWMSYAVRRAKSSSGRAPPDCSHWRLSYHRVGDRWDRTQLWP